MYYQVVRVFRFEISRHGFRFIQADLADAVSEKCKDLQGRFVSFVSYASNFSKNKSSLTGLTGEICGKEMILSGLRGNL
jgi:hypothetical protein